MKIYQESIGKSSDPYWQYSCWKSCSLISRFNAEKDVLELGGSDPYVILEDADLDQAVNACIAGRMLNTGKVVCGKAFHCGRTMPV
ncbi:MAG: hypothetical protein CM1200mP10_29570 [Candidatus Neomarinimicrobiota bacterium]|nr:MAG: hypothetical protein CM1200mP10_29570 [Candidatus Neomarinimicrobiota bacterium]